MRACLRSYDADRLAVVTRVSFSQTHARTTTRLVLVSARVAITPSTLCNIPMCTSTRASSVPGCDCAVHCTSPFSESRSDLCLPSSEPTPSPLLMLMRICILYGFTKALCSNDDGTSNRGNAVKLRPHIRVTCFAFAQYMRMFGVEKSTQHIRDSADCRLQSLSLGDDLCANPHRRQTRPHSFTQTKCVSTMR